LAMRLAGMGPLIAARVIKNLRVLCTQKHEKLPEKPGIPH
jgi:hypothetical protein